MPKPSPDLLRPERYPFRQEVATRFSDVDPNRHINNVAIAAILEDARAHLAFSGKPRPAMIASIAIEYLDQAFYPGIVTSCLAVESLGRTSWVMVQLLLQDGRPFAFARSVSVKFVDGQTAQLDEDDRAEYARLALRHG